MAPIIQDGACEIRTLPDTPRLMAAGPDIASIRAEYKRVWDRIMINLRNYAHHLNEE